MKLGGEDGGGGEGCDGEAEANGVLSVEGQLQSVALRHAGVCDVAGGSGGAHHVPAVSTLFLPLVSATVRGDGDHRPDEIILIIALKWKLASKHTINVTRK